MDTGNDYGDTSTHKNDVPDKKVNDIDLFKQTYKIPNKMWMLKTCNKYIFSTKVWHKKTDFGEFLSNSKISLESGTMACL